MDEDSNICIRNLCWKRGIMLKEQRENRSQFFKGLLGLVETFAPEAAATTFSLSSISFFHTNNLLVNESKIIFNLKFIKELFEFFEFISSFY